MGRELSWWDSDVTIEIPFTVDNASGSDINIKLRYQACNATNCQTPKTVKFDLAFNKEAAAIVADNASATAATTQLNQWWDPVSTTAPTTDQSPWKILILGLIGGLAALLTPCVWPMIPMTISFFLKKGKSTSKSKRDALTYGLSIVVIYLILGLAITMIFGAGKLNELSTNAIFNIFFFLLLVVFAISFFGAFDIKLPSRWSNAVDNKAENTSGILSIFLMAFTLVLVSFSCTGPIIGTLLVEAASQGNLVGPALGMGGFALGLAIPFSIFAFFPAMLKEMPKSGGWLNSVKVVLGFVELILSLKFLSVADMAYGWRLLDREVFVAIWIVLFILLGAYLLGKIRFSHYSEQSHVGVFRFFLATISLAFAVYLLPGLWGAPLKAVSAFVPPLETQDFNLYSHSDNYVELDDYDEAMTYAAENHKPVLIDFSGYGCVNCRNMEAEVFDTDQVRSYLKDNFVVVKLMVDDRAKLFTPITVDIDGKVTTLETVGEKWSYLQMHKFGANSQPYYIVLDNEGRPMNDPVYYDNNIDSFMNWLKTGLNNYKTQK
jgi:thiol:disulfide interchange protein DsbD